MFMINVRLKFTKGEEVKYISHLDLMRTFHRTIKRAGIPIAYSAGFNPHQEISFGAPLSLGVASMAEYMDMKLSSEISIDELKEALNKVSPAGIKIITGAILPEHTKNAMALVTHARYTIRTIIEGITLEELQNKIDEFLSQETIKVMKEQPKKNFELKEIDIRPMILSVKAIEIGNSEFYLNCMLKSGSKENLKPELLMVAFKEYMSYNILGIKINREEVYTEKDGKLVDLIEYIS